MVEIYMKVMFKLKHVQYTVDECVLLERTMTACFPKPEGTTLVLRIAKVIILYEYIQMAKLSYAGISFDKDEHL